MVHPAQAPARKCRRKGSDRVLPVRCSTPSASTQSVLVTRRWSISTVVPSQPRKLQCWVPSMLSQCLHRGSSTPRIADLLLVMDTVLSSLYPREIPCAGALTSAVRGHFRTFRPVTLHFLSPNVPSQFGPCFEFSSAVRVCSTLRKQCKHTTVVVTHCNCVCFSYNSAVSMPDVFLNF